MDRRQQKTRAAIFAAFGTLLEQKSFTNITVSEIIDEANIGRSTFYAHFETKDELLRAMCSDIFDHVFSDHLKAEKNHDFTHTNYNFEKKITHILYHLQENRKNLKGILACESGTLFMQYFKQYLAEMFSPFLDSASYHAPEEYVLNDLICGFAETVRWWITSKPEYSPEEIAAFFLECHPVFASAK